MKIIGYYNEHGYRIVAVDDTGQISQELYTAGNCPVESTAVVSSKEALPLETLREFCAQTGIEVAAEYNITQGLKGDLMVRWAGTEYEDVVQ